MEEYGADNTHQDSDQDAAAQKQPFRFSIFDDNIQRLNAVYQIQKQTQNPRACQHLQNIVMGVMLSSLHNAVIGFKANALHGFFLKEL